MSIFIYRVSVFIQEYTLKYSDYLYINVIKFFDTNVKLIFFKAFYPKILYPN